MLMKGHGLRRYLRLLPLVAAIVALPWFVDMKSLLATLASVAVAPVAVALLLNLATRMAAAQRSFALARATGQPISRGQCLEALFIANFWSLALPGVSAGAVATVMRYTQYGVRAPEALALLAASRVLELGAFTLLALIGLLLNGGMASQAQLLDHGFLVAAMTAAGRVLQRLSIAALGTGFSWAVLQGLLDAVTVMVLARALGMDIALSQALWINALAYFAILLPLSIAGLGVREAAVVFAIAPLGFSREAAVALALLMVCMTLANALIGGALHLRAALPGRTDDQRRA
jgi:hypothetical protein